MNVKFRIREDHDGVNDPATTDNETYAGGPDVGEWEDLDVEGGISNDGPLIYAPRYWAMVEDKDNVLLDYYVEAEDAFGNIARSPIQHVWIAKATAAGEGARDCPVAREPPRPTTASP